MKHELLFMTMRMCTPFTGTSSGAEPGIGFDWIHFYVAKGQSESQQ